MAGNGHVDCDVLVVGSGAGGFAAALTAAHHGAEVILTEKAPAFGGTTAYSAGVIWIPGTSHARKAGIADTPEDALTYLQNEVGNRLDRDKAEAFIAHGAPMLDFFERHSHVRYTLMDNWADYHPDLPGGANGGRSLLPDQFDGRLLGDRFRQLRAPLRTMTIMGGMMVGRDDLPHLLNMTRSIRSAAYVARIMARHAMDRLRFPRGTRIANGNALIARMALTAFEQDLPLWLSSPLTRLLTEDGKVTGAIVDRDGVETEVRTRRGVVLAAGGFPQSAELKARHYDHVRAGKNHTSLPPAANTGDGVRLAQAAGAGFANDAAHPAAWTPVSLVPQPDGGTAPFPHFVDRGKPGVIAVDRHGRRFANEADSYHDFVPGMFEACRDDDRIEAYLITDHRAIRRYGLGAAPPAPGRLGPHLRSGYVERGRTLAELAAKLGIDGDGLTATVTRFNGPAAQGRDPEFHKGNNAYNHFNGDPKHGPNPCVAPLATPPFYGLRMVPGELGTFVGLRTNRHAQVLRDDGAPIPGLYAAGNDMASVMGGTYPGAGITIGPAMTFGYIAGRHVTGVDA